MWIYFYPFVLDAVPEAPLVASIAIWRHLSSSLSFDPNYFFLLHLLPPIASLFCLIVFAFAFLYVAYLGWAFAVKEFFCFRVGFCCFFFRVVCVFFLSIGSEPELFGSGIRIMASEKELYISTDEEADPNSCYLQKFRLYETRSVYTYMFFIIVLRFWFVPSVLLLKFLSVSGFKFLPCVWYFGNPRSVAFVRWTWF